MNNRLKVVPKDGFLWEPPPHRTQVAYDGNGPHDDDMKERVAKLEALIPNLATKADIGEVRGDLHKMDASIVRWMLGTIIGLFLGFAGLFFTMTNSLKGASPSTTAAQPTPIIIQVPSQPGLQVEPAKSPPPQKP